MFMLTHTNINTSLPAGQCETDAVEIVLSQQRPEHFLNNRGIVVEFPAGGKKFVYSRNCPDRLWGPIYYYYYYYLLTHLLTYLLTYLLTAIEISPDCSSPYTSRDKQIRYKMYINETIQKNIIPTIQNTVNKSTYFSKYKYTYHYKYIYSTQYSKHPNNCQNTHTLQNKLKQPQYKKHTHTHTHTHTPNFILFNGFWGYVAGA